jgi:hypothetical protein
MSINVVVSLPRYQPDEDAWTNGSWPSLRKARLAHGTCVVEGGPYGGRIYTAGGSPEVPKYPLVTPIFLFWKNVKILAWNIIAPVPDSLLLYL